MLVGVDQLGSAITGGDPDETISSRLGKRKRDFGGEIPPFSQPIPDRSSVTALSLAILPAGTQCEAVKLLEKWDCIVQGGLGMGPICGIRLGRGS